MKDTKNIVHNSDLDLHYDPNTMFQPSKGITGATDVIGEFFMIFTLIAAIVLAVKFNATRDSYIFVNVTGCLVIMLFALILFFCCAAGSYENTSQKVLFEFLIMSVFLMTVSILILKVFSGFEKFRIFNFIILTGVYVLISVFWVLFWFFQIYSTPINLPKKIVSISVCLFASVYAVFPIFNFFTGTFYYFNDSNKLVYTDKMVCDAVISYVWYIFYAVFVLTRKCDGKTKFYLLSCLLFPAITDIVSAFLIFFRIEMWLEFAVVLAFLISLYLMFFNVYISRGRMLLLKEKELTETRLNSMILQINPHFIYNTLGSIVSLCRTSPSDAADLTRKFSNYLRDNEKNVSGSSMIQFSEELEIIRHYLDIEMVRFPNIELIFDIQDEDFLIPSLSVQPLVENAIKHGICRKRNSEGFVAISAYATLSEYVVRVADNGAGFDTEAPLDDKKHIGISNVRTRLWLLCRGTLNVTSTQGKGTVCEISIPRKLDLNKIK